MLDRIDKFFKIKDSGSSIKTEVIAGFTTFFAMCYIILVNPSQISGANSGTLYNAVFVGGAIAAVIGTLLMAFVAKKPFAQAAGMGLNSFFFVSFILPAIQNGGAPLTGYGAGLVIILLSGLIFMILSITGLREYIAKAMPECLKKSIPAGIGLFIAMIGFKNSSIIMANEFTFVQLADMTKWSIAAPVLAAFLGFVLIVIYAKSKWNWMRKGSMILGIFSSAILYYLFTWTLPSFEMQNIGTVFSDFGKYGFSVFKSASWKAAFDGVTVGSIFSVIMLIITFCLVDMFDTVGTIYGTCAQAGMLDENGDPIDLNKCMLCDSLGTLAGALLGTSSVTTFVESSSGVAEGGRTGFASVITAMCFLVCIFLSPLASIIPTICTAPALIYVGVLMLGNFAKVDMSDLRSAVPAFLTLILMPLTYSISNGIGVGAIAYVIITLCTGKFTKKDIVVTVIAVIFALRFALVAM